MPNLPCELLDHIVDLLHDSPITLRNCCLVSKSWVPRTRRHLFVWVEFRIKKSLESWKTTFPDPSTSPARYTKRLWIGFPQVVTTEDAEAGSWIASFSSVEHLEFGGRDLTARGWEVAFVRFRGFSPLVKSLRVDYVAFPPSQLSDLILSFPLLEDLSIINSFLVDPDTLSIPTQHSSLPVFTGLLNLRLMGGIGSVIHRWLSPPGGASMGFRKLTLTWFCEEDTSLTMTLVEKCSHTLESLDITCDDSCGDPRLASFSLSKATKLKYAVFRLGSPRVKWITLALQTVTRIHRDLRRISVDATYYLANRNARKDLRRTIEGGFFEEWLDLDRILVHLMESFSIRTGVIWTRRRLDGVQYDYVGCLFPEMMRRGMVTINLVG